MLPLRSFPCPGSLSSGAVDIFCRDFAPCLASPAQGLHNAPCWGVLEPQLPPPLQEARAASPTGLRMQAGASGASSGMGAAAAHAYSTGLEESRGKKHPCSRAATSPGLCPSHREIPPKHWRVCPHARAHQVCISPQPAQMQSLPLLVFLRSFLSRGLKFPGDVVSIPSCRSRAVLQGGVVSRLRTRQSLGTDSPPPRGPSSLSPCNHQYPVHWFLLGIHRGISPSPFSFALPVPFLFHQPLRGTPAHQDLCAR